MMNVKETLKKLHKRLPTLSLDELFELLDCYVEHDSNTIDWLNFKKSPIWEPNKVWYSTDNKNTITTTPGISCVTTKAEPEFVTLTNCTDGKIKYYDGGGSLQLKAEH